MNGMQLQGLMQRVLAGLVLLVVISYGAKLIYGWLQPLVPSLVVLVILLVLFSFIVRRFGR